MFVKIAFAFTLVALDIKFRCYRIFHRNNIIKIREENIIKEENIYIVS